MGIQTSGTDYQVPIKPDGELYMYELVTFGAAKRFYSDSVDEILEYLVPEYKANDTPISQISALLTHAFIVQSHLQAHINTAYGKEISAMEPRDRHLLENPRNAQNVPSVWNHSIPVVLVDASYEPYTKFVRPVEPYEASSHSILWLRPAQGAYNYLMSLDEAGYIVLAAARNGVV